MSSNYFSRQSGLIDSDRMDLPVVIIGAGGIGSWAAQALARLGFRYFTIVDPDVVGEENIASQAYDFNQIGAAKALALFERLSSIGDNITGLSVIRRFQEVDNGEIAGIVVCALDSLSARKELWEKVKRCAGIDFFVDARMGGETMRLFPVVMLNDAANVAYEKKLHNNVPIEDIPCSERAIVYNTQVVGGLVASLVKKFIMDEELPEEVVFDVKNYISISKKLKLDNP